MPENRLNFPTTRVFKIKISMKLFYQYMAIFFNFSPTLNRLHPLQVENYDSNSRLVVDKADNRKFGLERVKKRVLSVLVSPAVIKILSLSISCLGAPGPHNFAHNTSPSAHI